MSTKNKLSNAVAKIETLNSYNVDGYIIAPTPGLESMIQRLLKSNKPLVLFDRYFPSINTCNIIIDNRQGAYSGVMELFKNGYRNIAFITLVSDQMQMMDRRFGYKDAVAHNKQNSEIILEVPYSLDVLEISISTKELLDNNKKIDAILFATNYLTIAGLKTLKEIKYEIRQNFGGSRF